MTRKPNLALSVRQPFAELILRGEKKEEYRSMKTHQRGRVYVYASRKPGPERLFKKIGKEPGDLTVGLLVGTVQVVDCKGEPGDYRWILAKPKRLRTKLKPKRQPQPVWFHPF